MIVNANLPSRNLDATEAFYGRLGFVRTMRDDGWMILRRGEGLLKVADGLRMFALVDADGSLIRCLGP